MQRARTAIRTFTLLGAAVLVTACGGADEAAVDPAAATPIADPAASTVAATGAVDPVTGQPIDPTALGGDGTGGALDALATVPALVGDDVSGGLSDVSSDPLFQPKAVESELGAEPSSDGGDETASDSDTTDTAPAATKVSYSGAKIYVNGKVYSVNTNGSFPTNNPVFKLVAVSADNLEIELVAGEFTDSSQGIYLDKGELTSFLNQSEQLTYKVKYLRPITSSDGVQL